MGCSSQIARQRAAVQAGWWVLFLVCAFYTTYALYMGGAEILSQLGLVVDAPRRAVPIIFVIHSLAGSIVLVSGPLQFNRQLRETKTALHRLLGGAYVAGIWLASIGGLWSALLFEISLAAKISFGLLSILWFGSTTIALLRILERDVSAHREWMIRSFSLSLFFVSFSVWVPGLAGTGLPETVSFPLAVFLSWSCNLAVAEIWIRHTRFRELQPSTSTKSRHALQDAN